VRYELIIYWSKDDNSFIVEVPELPGCMADGQTYAEAVNMPRVSSTNGLKPRVNSADQFRSRAANSPTPE